MRATRLAALCVFVVLLTASRLYAQETLATARELYASAEYDNALRLLDSLSAAPSSQEDRQAIELYRTLCLLAVGRRADAERTIEMMIVRDPLYRLAEDISPRVHRAFGDAKMRVLPAVVKQQYQDAKAAFDRQDFVSAATRFKGVVDVLKDPDLGSAAMQPPLSDLGTLAAGFHDLSVKAIPPPPRKPVEPAPAVAVASPIYTGDDRNVRPPIVIRQDFPKFPHVVRRGGIKGAIEIVIDEEGRVESAAMVVGTVEEYDRILLAAANKWLYEPATVDGKPVTFRRRIQVNIAAEPSGP